MPPELREQLQSTLGDAYTLGPELGGGGMARVFVADDRALGRKVVIKVLPPDFSTLRSVDRFRREIQFAASLQHPHVVPLLSAGDAGGLLYFTMPLVEGRSLRDRLRREGALPIADVVRTLQDVADALAYAHARGVVHRDIKPDNVLLSGHHALVTDFGVAKALSAATTDEARERALTMTGTVLGTPMYMAPEQVSADPEMDHRADLYALGVLAYEMLAGRPPFVGPSSQAVLVSQVVDQPEPVTNHRDRIPPELASLVMQCLAKHPADRPESADDVLRRLATVASSATLAVEPVRAPWWGARRTRVLAAVAGVALVGGGALGYRGWRPSLDPRVVAFAPLENATGEARHDHLGRLAADRLAGVTSEVDYLRVVPGSLPGQVPSEPEARRAGRRARAGTVVWGSVHREGDSLRVQLRVSDVTRQRLLGIVEHAGPAHANPSRLLDTLGQRVAGLLAQRLDPQYLYDETGRTTTWAVYREWREGVRADEAGDTVGAVARFERVIALDSAYPPGYWNAAATLRWLRREARAESLLAVAERQSHLWTTFERTTLLHHRAHLEGNVAQALEHARRAATMQPNAQTLLELAADAYRTRRFREALATTEQIARLGAITDTSSRYLVYVETRVDALHGLGHDKEALRELRRARRAFPENYSVLLGEARLLAALGRTDELHDRLDVIESVSRHSLRRGRNDGPGTGMLSAVEEMLAHGHAASMPSVLDRALASFESQLPEVRRSRTHRLFYARALLVAGREREAYAILDPLVREIPDAPRYVALLGIAAARLGDRATAERLAARLESMSNAPGWSVPLENAATIYAQLGERDRAVAVLKLAASRNAFTWYMLRHHFAFAPLRNYPPFEELLQTRD